MVVDGVEWTLRFDDDGNHHWEAPGISEAEKEEASIDLGQLAQAPSPTLNPQETSFRPSSASGPHFPSAAGGDGDPRS